MWPAWGPGGVGSHNHPNPFAPPAAGRFCRSDLADRWARRTYGPDPAYVFFPLEYGKQQGVLWFFTGVRPFYNITKTMPLFNR